MNDSTWAGVARLAGAGDQGQFDAPLVQPFPEPSQRIAASMSQLHLAATTALDDEQIERLAQLPRPWDPASCHGPLRREIWHWLDQVAVWVNTQHLWGVDHPGIPSCWPRHPHLVHDLAVIAATRYLTGYAVSPAPLEDWHRHALPAFLDRVAERLAGACLSGHQPGRPRTERDREHVDALSSVGRSDLFSSDARAAELFVDSRPPSTG